MSLVMLLPIVLLVLALIVGLSAAKNRGAQGDFHPRINRDAMQILDERFARGEIDEAEYVRKKTVLKR